MFSFPVASTFFPAKTNYFVFCGPLTPLAIWTLPFFYKSYTLSKHNKSKHARHFIIVQTKSDNLFQMMRYLVEQILDFLKELNNWADLAVLRASK